MSHDAAHTIDYATRRYQSARRLNVPRWLSLGSITPLALFPLMLFTSGYWSRWFNTGQAWERDCGIAWLVALSISAVCSIAAPFCRKRWDIWAAVSVHIAFILISLLPPGVILLFWLMHWMHGPGA